MFLLIDKLNLTTTLDAHLFAFIKFTIKIFGYHKNN